jgi:hypothetical protein
MTFVATAIGAGLGYGIGGTLTGAAIGASIGGTIGGSMAQAKAAKQSAQMQSDAAKYAADMQREMFDIQNLQQKPYREAGYGALTRIGELLPGLTKPLTREDILGMPGFQTAIEQGTGAARQTMNVGGGGSNVDRAAQKFAIDYTVQQAMPQALQQRQNIYNTLAGIAGIGQVAQGQTTNLASNVAGNIGQAAIGGATALGAGQVGAANAMMGGIGNLTNAGLMYSYLNRSPTAGLFPSGGSFPVIQQGAPLSGFGIQTA